MLRPFLLHSQDVFGENVVRGAGSTFAFPVISKWANGYQRWLANGGDFPSANAGLDNAAAGVALDYEPVGSLAGTMRVKQAAVDFGASDVPLRSDDLAKINLVQFPLVIGGVIAVVNIDGVAPGAIRFDGPVLADIFLGKIDNWSNPAIKALNPGPETAGREDRGHPPFRRLRHHVQFHRLSVAAEPGIQGEDRLRPDGAVAGRHRRQGQ